MNLKVDLGSSPEVDVNYTKEETQEAERLWRKKTFKNHDRWSQWFCLAYWSDSHGSWAVEWTVLEFIRSDGHHDAIDEKNEPEKNVRSNNLN